MYEGHLRGTNIRNAIVIWDEAQNNSISSAKTILTRLDNNCKMFVIGSTNQIDNKFVNKFNNALTFLLAKVYDDNKDVRISGMELKKVERSRIAEWADNF
jgi:predicted ribonuclease YlaK